MKKGEKIYMVWHTENAGTENEYGFWNHYQNIEDAVSEEESEEVEIYEATPKRLGMFRQKVSAAKIREKKDGRAEKRA